MVLSGVAVSDPQCCSLCVTSPAIALSGAAAGASVGLGVGASTVSAVGLFGVAAVGSAVGQSVASLVPCSGGGVGSGV